MLQSRALEQIKMKVHVWHANEDQLVGNMSKYIAEQLPNAELIELEGAGHLWVIEHMREVLEQLVPDAIVQGST